MTTGLKEYYIKEENYSKTPKLGDKEGSLIAAIDGTSGTDRFYIMALEDFKQGSTTTFCWYEEANGKITDYKEITSEAFGSGKTNTANMIAKWNVSAYGEQSNNDVWGVIQAQVKQGWFLPSESEWAAFGAVLNITTENYSTYGLDGFGYWTSAPNNPAYVSNAMLDFGDFGNSMITVSNKVRLCATF